MIFRPLLSLPSRLLFGASATIAPIAFAGALVVLAGCANTQVAATQATATVAAMASAQPELGTFNRLVKQAGLQTTLEASGPVTVFAPSDDAFKAVPAATLDKLARDPEFLKTVLSNHVVPGLVKAGDVTGSQSLTTSSGNKLTLSKAGDFVTVEDGLVTKADVLANNGVVHLIDSVLIPPVKK